MTDSTLSSGRDLSITALQRDYASGALTPLQLLNALQPLLAASNPAAWIYRLDAPALQQRAQELEALGPGPQRPLYGIPFAVKDNIDVAGLPTTAACPAFSYIAEAHATVVQRLLDAGAILIGKTNLDQFATGLVGTRSPYGTPSSTFSAEHISGGSSSGSAVVVSEGCVSFALGTDTAGSGRVPAAFNNIVGAKPTRGWLPTTGVVPACRSLDCVSVFAISAGEAWQVLCVAGGADPADPWSRHAQAAGLPARPRIGVLRAEEREFFGDAQAAAHYADMLEKLATLGELVEFDFAPFAATAALLYDGPWVAERLEATKGLLQNRPESLDPTVLTVIARGLEFDAAQAMQAQTRLQALRQQIAPVWRSLDLLALPSAPTQHRIAAVQADPVRLNSQLGHYTNFTNLLDLCAVAVPGPLRPDGLPAGVTLLAPAWHDAALARLADTLHRSSDCRVGHTRHALPPPGARMEWPATPEAPWIRLAVIGAHLSGMPLNHELTERAARFVRACHTAPAYRLYALPGSVPPKPGLQAVSSGGVAIVVEVWELTPAAFGDFVARIPAPLGIGSLILDNGETLKGFLCEHTALTEAEDISPFGGWRAYIAHRSAV
ncbi:allophanate hydrolase [Uliginosibacterium aquaticum]|uniref:Allophanate hydrolase n=1 Tax=Uliginosibacterium aquaticum TaxID=2731212 RepID=A0ABX2IR59_9RHOO|nr:allophanate hydrolase [Uliginosibacterium aquaticum]NSL56485.1 allophanate hydrolase [Uliginosibacterium aquaticum]